MEKETILEMIEAGDQLEFTSYEKPEEIAQVVLDNTGNNPKVEQVEQLSQYDGPDFEAGEKEVSDGDWVYLIHSRPIDPEMFLAEAWDNLPWDGMETVLYVDSDCWTRQQGSTGTDEDDILYKLSLDSSYWIDSSVVNVDDEGNVAVDEDEKENFKELIAEEMAEAVAEKGYKLA